MRKFINQERDPGEQGRRSQVASRISGAMDESGLMPGFISYLVHFSREKNKFLSIDVPDAQVELVLGVSRQSIDRVVLACCQMVIFY